MWWIFSRMCLHLRRRFFTPFWAILHSAPEFGEAFFTKIGGSRVPTLP